MPGRVAYFFDTHAHLTDPQFDADRDAVLARAEACGVNRLVEIGDSPEDWPRVLALARSRPQSVRCALGLHPDYADRCTAELRGRLAAESGLPEVAAVGALGIHCKIRTQRAGLVGAEPRDRLIVKRDAPIGKIKCAQRNRDRRGRGDRDLAAHRIVARQTNVRVRAARRRLVRGGIG